MNGPMSDLQPNRICIAAVGFAIVMLVVYFVAMWHGWLPSLRAAGTGIGAYCGVVALWNFYDIVIRTKHGWVSAFGPLALVVAGLGAYIMAFH